MSPDLYPVAAKHLDALTAAISGRDSAAFAGLFRADGSWRDVLAVTGSLRTADGPAQIGELLEEAFGRSESRTLQIDRLTRIEQVTRYATDLLEVFFTFTTDIGSGEGILRLTRTGIDENTMEALTLLTVLQTLDPVEDATSAIADTKNRDLRSRFWADVRHEEVEFDDREPVVLVVGAGQAGLAIGAWLKHYGVDALIVDRFERVGDTWRSRYRALALHNDTRMNHLPFLPFPDFFPRFIPKDKLGNWFEFYADTLELNVWTGTTFLNGAYDATAHRWDVRVDRRGSRRTLHPRHIVLATGVSGVPLRPELPGLDDFRGTALHTADYVDGHEFDGRRVLVVGSGASGHDVSHDLHSHGAEVTMMQRSPTIVTSVEAANNVYSALYTSGRQTDECDLIGMSGTYPLLTRYTPTVTKRVAELDKELLDGLHAVGFETHFGEGDMGYPMEFRKRGGGYYLDVGGSQLLIEQKVSLIHARDVDHVTATGVELADGSALEFDVIIFATGYKSIQEGVRRLLGSEIADRVGPVWGLDAEGELRNMARRTAQEGLWFLGGGFPETRKHSRHLALQILAVERGIQL
jgi:cation diffusion facilitator CzcD-associated flavoprotein CzcO